MPFLRVVTSLSLSNERKHELCEEIGKCVSLVPGKYREITTIDVVDGCYIEHGDEEHRTEPCFNVEFRILGKSTFNSKRDFVRETTRMLSEKFGVKPDHIFINIFECDQWGIRGNFRENSIIDTSLYD